MMATYRMDYPNLAAAVREIGKDLEAGRVESIQVGGRMLMDNETAALLGG